MTKAFKCDICGKYIDGSPSYKATITNRHVDPRDESPDSYLDLCSECGTPLWGKEVTKYVKK